MLPATTRGLLGCAKHVGDERGRRGLPVAPGDGDDRRVAEPRRHFDLGVDREALPERLLHEVRLRRHAGRDRDEVGGERALGVAAGLVGHARRVERGAGVGADLAALGEEHRRAVRREQLRHGEAAARGPDHGHGFISDVVGHEQVFVGAGLVPALVRATTRVAPTPSDTRVARFIGCGGRGGWRSRASPSRSRSGRRSSPRGRRAPRSGGGAGPS